jgi:putative ABC transport system permease protein
MRLRRSLGPSLRALLAHKVRAALALTSIAAGVAAVFLTSAIGQGAESEVLRGIESMGTRILVVRPAQVKRLASRKAIQGFVRSLELGDYEAIAELAIVQAAVPAIERMVPVKAGSGMLMIKALGTTPAFPSVKRFRMRAGRFFDGDENRLRRRVAVLGARACEKLFPGESALGATIRIRGVPFAVVGILEGKGVQADGSDEDNQVLIPVETALRRVFGATWLTSVFVSVRGPESMASAQIEIQRLLRERHRLRSEKPDDFAVQDRTKFLVAQKEMADTLTLFTTGLAAVALLVGGVGILALMLLSVKERTGEIGLRRAVGARPRDILIQFLFEAAMLALLGWVAGIAAGALGTAAISLGTAWKIVWPMKAALASLMMAAATGFGFGALPARRASVMPPIQALAAE